MRRLAPGLIIGALVLAAAPARAQDFNFGFRGGVSANPDQGFLGGHLETQPIVDRVHLRPNVEIGFGDDFTVTAFNFEAVYKWPLQSPWTVYAGAGPAIDVVKAKTETDAEAGWNFLGGIEHSRGWFIETKLGVIESPDLKITVGYTLKR